MEGKIRTVGLFLKKDLDNNPEYQLYGLYQQFKDATKQDLEPPHLTIDCCKGIKGLILGTKRGISP